MVLHQPRVEFIDISMQCIHTASQESQGEVCQVNSNNPNVHLMKDLCGKHAYPADLTEQQYCESFDEEPPVGYFEGKPVNVAKSVNDIGSIKGPAVPQSTASPARSAPHFNNDLFN